MDKNAIVERISQIEKDMNATKSNYAMLEGHMAEAKHWLSEIVKSESNIEKNPEIIEGELQPSVSVNEEKPKKVYKKKKNITNPVG